MKTQIAEKYTLKTKEGNATVVGSTYNTYSGIKISIDGQQDAIKSLENSGYFIARYTTWADLFIKDRNRDLIVSVETVFVNE